MTHKRVEKALIGEEKATENDRREILSEMARIWLRGKQPESANFWCLHVRSLNKTCYPMLENVLMRKATCNGLPKGRQNKLGFYHYFLPLSSDTMRSYCMLIMASAAHESMMGPQYRLFSVRGWRHDKRASKSRTDSYHCRFTCMYSTQLKQTNCEYFVI
jgi:hypothetical protein